MDSKNQGCVQMNNGAMVVKQSSDQQLVYIDSDLCFYSSALVGVSFLGRCMLFARLKSSANLEQFLNVFRCHKACNEGNRNDLGIKRLIGRKCSDPYVREAAKMLPFRIFPDTEENPLVVVSLKSVQKRFSAEEISAMILKGLKVAAEEYLGRKVDKAVICVPAYFNDSQRQATRDAGTIAGLSVLRILNEASAAEIAYGFQKRGTGPTVKKIVILDPGGDSLDVSVVCIDGGVSHVLGSAGDTHLGGEEMDERMVSHFVEHYKRATSNDGNLCADACWNLRIACEAAKKNLSSISEAYIKVDSLVGGVDFSSSITCAAFNNMNDDIFTKCEDLFRECLKAAEMDTKDFGEVFLVGGSTRIHKLQLKLIEVFGKDITCSSINPEEAVAYGAALHAAALSNKSEILNNMLLLEATSYSLGIKKEESKMEVLIPRNRWIPHPLVLRCLRIPIEVYEGLCPEMKSENKLLGRFSLSDIPLGELSDVTVYFEVNSDGILEVSAETTVECRKINVISEKRRLFRMQMKKAVVEVERCMWKDIEEILEADDSDQPHCS